MSLLRTNSTAPLFDDEKPSLQRWHSYRVSSPSGILENPSSAPPLSPSSFSRVLPRTYLSRTAHPFRRLHFVVQTPSMTSSPSHSRPSRTHDWRRSPTNTPQREGHHHVKLPSIKLNAAQELAAVTSFLASLPQNIIPHTVDPSLPIDPPTCPRF